MHTPDPDSWSKKSRSGPEISVSDPDSLNPDPDPANLVDPDPGLKKLFKNKILKIEFKWTFLN